MSAVSPVSPIPASKNSEPPLAQCRIEGQIRHKSRRITTQNGTRWLTVVSLPAPNPYTPPSVVELRSVERLGDQGDVVKVLVQVGGYPRTYSTEDEDGRRVAVPTATVTLDVL